MQFSWSVISQGLVSGVLLGGMFALIAVGLTLIWGVMGIINFAHGEFLMVGLYVAYFAVSAGLSPYLSFIVTIPATTLLGIVVYKALISPILKDPMVNQIMLTLGLMLILQNLALLFFKADVQTVRTAWTTRTIHLGGTVVGVSQLIMLVGAILCIVGIWWFLKYTDYGRSIRATAQNPDAASLMGIDVRQVYLVAFGLGSATLGYAASLMIPFYYAAPTVGLFLGLIAFIVEVLGGMGNLFGCLIGGFIMGMGEALGAAMFPGSLSRVFSFGIFVILLVLMPRGVLSRRRA